MIHTLADTLEANFVYPETGQAYAEMLRSNARSSKYSGLAGEDLAAQLTHDLQALHRDGHLKVVAKEVEKSQQERAKPRRPAQRRSCIGELEWLRENIVLLELNEFPGEEANLKQLRDALDEMAGAEAILLDLRHHRGGGLMEIDIIFAELLRMPAHLVTMEMRAEAESPLKEWFDALPSLHRVDAPAEVIRWEHRVAPAEHPRFCKIPVFFLTSERTASAAEHMSLAARVSGAATVVGSKTMGAGHFGSLVDLPDGFKVFLPVGRTYDPRDGKDWEGTGVAPDIACDPTDAVDRALSELNTGK